MDTNEVMRVYPTIELLCDNRKGRPKSSLKNDAKKLYHCPVETCKYNKDSSFGSIKFLKQHYVKVHKTKTFSCAKCEKRFPLESTLRSHEPICGIKYRCYCNAEFNTYEAFLTHAKRKNHGNILKYKDMMKCIKVHTTAQTFQKFSDNALKVRAIIVEDTQKKKLVILKKKQANPASSKETQTGMKMCKILPKVSSETQTVGVGNVKKTVSMQTTTVPSRKRRRSRVYDSNSASRVRSKVNLSTSATQTAPIKEETFMLTRSEKLKAECCEFDESYTQGINLEDVTDKSNSLMYSDKKVMLTDDPNLGSMSSTNNWEDGKSCSAETQTDVGDKDASNDFNLIFYSDNGTQTAFEDCFDSSYTDTYTQTCDSLFCDLGDFVDIETQTAWSIFDDPLKSEEDLS